DVTGDGLRRLRIGPQLVASVADGDAEQHPDEDDQGQSLRAHALPHSTARKACAIWRCKRTVIARGSDTLTGRPRFLTCGSGFRRETGSPLRRTGFELSVLPTRISLILAEGRGPEVD